MIRIITHSIDVMQRLDPPFYQPKGLNLKGVMGATVYSTDGTEYSLFRPRRHLIRSRNASLGIQ